MKVILLEEVTGQGHEGDVVDVARGYAVNYLLPRRLAIEATKGNLKQLEARRANIERREAARRADAESLRALLDGKSVTIEAKAGEEGRLFGSVTSHMIEDAILEQLDLEVDRRKMDIGAHIKDIGEHDVTVRITHDVSATVVVRVVPEGGELEDRVSFMDDAERAAAQIMAAQGLGDDESAAEILEGEGEDDETGALSAEEAAMHVETETDLDSEELVGVDKDTVEDVAEEAWIDDESQDEE
jgi:large subunit ribosomal protein L9